MALGVSFSTSVYALRYFVLTAMAFAMLGFGGCSKEAPRMSDEWCEALMVKPNKEWTEQDAEIFARDCLYNDEKE